MKLKPAKIEIDNSYILQLLHLGRWPSTLLSQPAFTKKPFPSQPYLLRQLHPQLLLLSLLQLRLQRKLLHGNILFLALRRRNRRRNRVLGGGGDDHRVSPPFGCGESNTVQGLRGQNHVYS